MSKVKIEEQIGGAIMYLSGEFIGGDETDELKDKLNEIAQQEKKKLIIDLDNVKYLNSTALGVLISAHSNFAKRNGEIILCNVGESIENIFVITKLSLVFHIEDTLNDAIKFLS